MNSSGRGTARVRRGPRSLAGRLLLASALVTVLSLGLVLGLMQVVLTRFVTGQIDQRLDNKLVALASQMRAGPDGTISIPDVADGPPFDRPEHRSFWIIQGPRNVLRSRWLTAGEVNLPPSAELAQRLARPGPPGPAPAGLATHPRTLQMDGLGTTLHLRMAQAQAGPATAIIMVAAPADAIRAPVREAMTSVGLGVLALGTILAGLGFLQVRLGLRPLQRLRSAVTEVAEGRRNSIPEDQPAEVEPLVAELNALLARNAAHLERARRHVANLAHGLKTPLATLTLCLERADEPVREEARHLLADIDQRVRHHLSRARAGVLVGPERARTILMPRLIDIGEALGRVYAERGAALTIDGSPDVALACESADVDEIFGNLLDNAFKFAANQIACSVRQEARNALVTIADDGPGLSAEQSAVVLEPGRRLDESVPGFGFGLTIARELIELYGGELELASLSRGLAVSVRLPLADRSTTDVAAGTPVS